MSTRDRSAVVRTARAMLVWLGLYALSLPGLFAWKAQPWAFGLAIVLSGWIMLALVW